MSQDVIVDAEALRAEVREKYREVAARPDGVFHFHTGRPLAARLGYDQGVVDSLPDRAVESFTGVADPFSLRGLQAGERVLDVGSGAGFDSFIAPCSSPISPTANRSRPKRCARSTCGPVESPVACRVQAGPGC
jgi:hypothetical protein